MRAGPQAHATVRRFCRCEPARKHAASPSASAAPSRIGLGFTRSNRGVRGMQARAMWESRAGQ
eukprot:2720569-Alexandrium_andersonii.AAC.1